MQLLIWDEVHEAQNADRGNGRAFGRIAGVADHVLAMTGTPFNGYASSTLNLEYHLNPRTHRLYNWGGAPRYERKPRGTRRFADIIANSKSLHGEAESRWVQDMGVLEQTVEERPSFNEAGAFVGMTTYERPYTEAPGISPRLVAETMDHTIFFSLTDMAEGLPEYEEIALPVALDADVASTYHRTIDSLKNYLNECRFNGDNSFLGAYFHYTVDSINSSFRPYTITHNQKRKDGTTDSHVVKSIASFGENRIYAKEQQLLDTLTEELAAGRPCVVYFRQTNKNDLQPRLQQLIAQHVPLARPFILTQKVPSSRREKAIESAISQGAQPGPLQPGTGQNRTRPDLRPHAHLL